MKLAGFRGLGGARVIRGHRESLFFRSTGPDSDMMVMNTVLALDQIDGAQTRLN